MAIVKHYTRTGCIISDTDKKMEYLYVGEYHNKIVQTVINLLKENKL